MDAATIVETIAALAGVIAKLIAAGPSAGATVAQMTSALAALQDSLTVVFAADDAAARATEATRFDTSDDTPPLK